VYVALSNVIAQRHIASGEMLTCGEEKTKHMGIRTACSKTILYITKLAEIGGTDWDMAC